MQLPASLDWHVWSSSSGNNCHVVQRSLSSSASVYECIMGFYLVPFRQPSPLTLFLLITAIGLCQFLPVHHFGMACLTGSNVNIQQFHLYALHKDILQILFLYIYIYIYIYIDRCFDLLIRPKMPFKVMHRKEVTHCNGSNERKSRGRKLADEMDEVKKFPLYSHRLTHRKRVTSELHDSYFHSMTITQAIPKIAEVTHPDRQISEEIAEA